MQIPPPFLWSQDLVRIFSSSLMSYPKMANQKTSVGDRIWVHPNKTNNNKDTPLMPEKRMRRIGVSTTLSDLRFLFWRLCFMHLEPIWPLFCLEKASLFGGPIDLQKIEVIWAPGNCFGQKFFRSSVRLETPLYLWGTYTHSWSTYTPVVVSIFLSSTLPGEMIHFDEYYSTGLKPPTRKGKSLPSIMFPLDSWAE